MHCRHENENIPLCGKHIAPGVWGVLRVSSDWDDRKIFWGWEFSVPGFLGLENLAKVFFWEG